MTPNQHSLPAIFLALGAVLGGILGVVQQRTPSLSTLIQVPRVTENPPSPAEITAAIQVAASGKMDGNVSFVSVDMIPESSNLAKLTLKGGTEQALRTQVARIVDSLNQAYHPALEREQRNREEAQSQIKKRLSANQALLAKVERMSPNALLAESALALAQTEVVQSQLVLLQAGVVDAEFRDFPAQFQTLITGNLSTEIQWASVFREALKGFLFGMVAWALYQAVGWLGRAPLLGKWTHS